MTEEINSELESGSPFQVGSIVAERYEIRSLLGGGATGTVFQVVDLTLDRETCALKLLHPKQAQDEQSLGRFRNEVILARKLGHKNIARTFEFGTAGRFFYITMEYLPFGNLSHLIRGENAEALDLRARLCILKEIAEGLAYAHDMKVIHRDLKPENILISDLGQVKISDFGLARSLSEEKGLTRVGETVGTPCYMAPEQFRGDKIDGRADIYAFGILAFEILTGERPFYNTNYRKLADLHILYPLPKIANKHFRIPVSLERIVRRCAEKAPSERYQNAHQIVHDLLPHL